MKKLLLTASFFCLAWNFGASQNATGFQSKINAAGRLLISDYTIQREEYLKKEQAGDLKTLSAEVPAEPIISAVVILREGYTSEALAGLDLSVLSEMDGVIVVKCPLTVTEKIAALPQVISIGFGEELKPTMNYARPSGSVSDVQNGFDYEGTQMSFDGSGVIVGLMDTGLEANHINFKNDDGTSRIQRLWYMKSSDGTYDEYNASTIGGFTTDTRSQSHATHVAGIMAGSYKGNGTYRYVATASGSSCTEKTDEPIPYYGVATGADLAFAVGSLYTPNIIQGVTNIMDYAESVGKPAVVNLSLGHVVGPHDGSDYYSQALSRLGQRGIICMSAGNDGDSKLTIIKAIDTSTTTGSALRTFPFSIDNSGNTLYGQANGIVDIWSSSGDPVTFSLKAFNGGSVNNAVEILTADNAGSYTTSGNATFANYFSGTVKIETGKNANNDRYEVYITFDNVARLATNTTFVLMIEATAANGTTLYAFGSDISFYNKMSATAATTTACSDGNAANSINDGACADNVISVGAYTSRVNWGTFNSNSTYYYTGHGTLNQIAPFSSYGQKFVNATESVKLPLVSGPGSAIISSYSSYYLGTSTNSMTAKVVNGTNTYWWGAMQGTSMSCPFVTGTIGLWLQAWPEMTYDDVMAVINKTSTYDTNRLSANYNGTTADKAKWGAGMLNGLEGIKEVLAMKTAGIGEVWADEDQRLVITPADGGYDVFVAGAGNINATVYDLQGRPVAAACGSDGTVGVTTSDLQPGVYILEARGSDFRFTRKITRR